MLTEEPSVAHGKRKNLIMKKKIFELEWISSKYFSQFGSAVRPAIANI